MASFPFPNTPNLPHLPIKTTKSMQSLHFPTTHFTKIHEKQEKPQHPSTSYFHHISSLCKEGRLQEAVSFLNQMQSQNLQIGPQFYGELLQGCVYERAVFPDCANRTYSLGQQ
ncbi:hypothetical protein AAC387_Pa02g2172 [Persea americana]